MHFVRLTSCIYLLDALIACSYCGVNHRVTSVTLMYYKVRCTPFVAFIRAAFLILPPKDMC